MSNLNKKHYQEYITNLHAQEKQEQPPIGRKPRDWYRDVTGDECDVLSIKKINRKELKEFCKNKEHTEIQCFASVMAWGGQRVGYGRMVYYTSFKHIEPVIKKLRTGEMDRAEAYSAFHNLRIEKKLKGMGIADRKSTRLNSSHDQISYADFCLKKKINETKREIKSKNV